MARLISILAMILTLMPHVWCQDSPSLEFALELRVGIGAPIDIGPTSHGRRVVIPITGGTFEGPAIKGEVIPGGADYQLVDELSGRTELEAIYCIRTDDGINIHVRNSGLLINSRDGSYFYTVPRFEAPSDSHYSWLNDAIFVCRPGGFDDGRIVLRVWRVCDPSD